MIHKVIGFKIQLFVILSSNNLQILWVFNLCQIQYIWRLKLIQIQLVLLKHLQGGEDTKQLIQYSAGWLDQQNHLLYHLIFIHFNSYSSSGSISSYIVHIVQLARGTSHTAVLFTAVWRGPLSLSLSCMHARTSLAAPSDGKSSCPGRVWHLTCTCWRRRRYSERFEFVKKLWSIWSNIVNLAYDTKPEA